MALSSLSMTAPVLSMSWKVRTASLLEVVSSTDKTPPFVSLT